MPERSDPRSTPALPIPAEWRRVLERQAELEKEVERLRRENERLRRELEKALRAAKRQAAPFARPAPKDHPRKPGRKPGCHYGRAHWRPLPEEIEETLEASLPARCPDCGGAVEVERIAEQYQTEWPPIRPRHLRFRVAVGRCRQCGTRLQGRHRQQTSDALGVAASQLGPQAVAGAVWLVKGLGLSHEKARAVLEQLGGLGVSRSGLCRAIARAGRKAEPTYQQLVQIVGGRRAQFPRAIQTLLQSSLDLRDRCDRGQISPHGLAVARGKLEARLDRVLERRTRSPANRRLQNHLWREREALFPFLYCPGLEATNWRAEQAIRPLVVARKVWGGNRTPAGARTQQILCSVLRTCWQQGRSPLSTLCELLCCPLPKAIPLLGCDLSPPHSSHYPLTSPHPPAALAAVA